MLKKQKPNQVVTIKKKPPQTKEVSGVVVSDFLRITDVASQEVILKKRDN